MTDRYAVFGNPIEHSKSPLIHKLFAEQTKQNMAYDKQLVPLDGFAAAAKKFFSEGGAGLNITVPFKLDAFSFADELSPRAKLAGAVNTLKLMPNRKIFGDNTDGAGLVRDITQNLGWKIKGKNILILGAGGAVRGILDPLLQHEPKSISIENRTVEKTEALVKLFNTAIAPVQARGAGDVSFDLVINGTSASLANELPSLNSAWLSANAGCYDMVYAKNPTPFLSWTQQQACHHIADGLGMLVEQAAESFFIWRGIKPETKSVIEKVRQQL